MAVTITKHPESVTANEMTSISFSVEATGDGLTYQWKQSSNGRSWSNSSLASAKKPTLTMSASINRQGYYFRCVVTDSSGNTATSNSARLTVLHISITKQPSSVEVEAGSQAVFTVGASGDGLIYQWQCKAPDGINYVNTTQTGYNTNTLTVEAIKEYDKYQYRCQIHDMHGNVKTSSGATLTIKTLFEILKQPENRTGLVGEDFTLSVEISSSNNPYYQWKFCEPNTDGWQNSIMEGYNTNTLIINNAASEYNGYKFYCEITNDFGDILESKIVTLTILETLPEYGIITWSIISDIADAIREKTGLTRKIMPKEFKELILSILSSEEST